MKSVQERFNLLIEGAKYDVSCSSSGSDRGAKKGSVGFCNPAGICHSFTSDGRCVSLLKILMTNSCIHDCKYCVNRRSADGERAILTPEELCAIVMNFYIRNYIEGLFLSSAVYKNADYTMELLLQTVKLLRTKYGYNGYIHLKGIPGASSILVDEAAKWVDRMSVNVELPSRAGLQMLAPSKKTEEIAAPMKRMSELYIAQKEGELKRGSVIPAGQTTQMIIGATKDSDGTIMRVTERLYRQFSLKRVYYSAYIPVGDSSVLPVIPPNLIRENRLYQADWLLRFYGFDADELVSPTENLSLEMDPKSAWALKNLDKFPIEVNKADYLELLRVPGIGVKSADRIVRARRYSVLRYEDLVKMKVVMKRASNFLLCDGKYYGRGFNEELIRSQLIAPVFAKSEPLITPLFESGSLLPVL